MCNLLWVICPLKPLHDVEIATTVQRDGILVEQIRTQYKVAIGSELVGDQLRVDKTMADDICDAVMVHWEISLGQSRRSIVLPGRLGVDVQENGLFCGLVLRIGNIGLEITNLDEFPLGLTFMCNTFVAA